jgi:hypothetical protein
MNLDINRHQTYITAPNDSSKVVREAIPPAGQPKVVFPGPTDQQPGLLPNDRTNARSHSSFYGVPLTWRGLHLLGITIGIAAIWFVAAWVRHGRMPLGLQQPRTLLGGNPDPILPPVWLLTVLGLLLLISFCMMLFGTQDAAPRITFNKDNRPNKIPVDTARKLADPQH